MILSVKNRTGEEEVSGLLNRENPLSVTKVICGQSPSYLAGNMNASVANQKTGIKLPSKIIERIKKSYEKHLVNTTNSE